MKAEWSTAEKRPIITFKAKTCHWDGKNQEECCKLFGLQYRKDIQVSLEKTGRDKDPKSECFQLPANSPKP